ncbi:carbonate dehydratase, eukaryotic-type [Dictyocaulus viviparus]|uniref:Carbonate dehydratase, eukaryotic-type n=1 Tax=Dictyocaulus viviparus TaxID=29172 RepID=A0A0D8Y1Q2_DICVI|nr:carbonate dehydratase, eukaryotic-type [Dictyocaulus viviparus]
MYVDGTSFGPLFTGPQNWGLLFKPWMMCHNGKMQSPIDITPDRLLFDPNMRPIYVDRISVMSEMVNTGQMPRIRIGNSLNKPSANLTGGPLHGYKYRIQRIDIHVGRGDINGSEHTIDGRRFPIEIQLLAYNIDLYNDFTSASHSPHGIAAISVLVDYGDKTNEELLKLTMASAGIMYKGQRVELIELEPWRLLPYTRNIVSYEGSMTSPGCHETVTWIIINQPIHITSEDVSETVETKIKLSNVEDQKKSVDKLQMAKWGTIMQTTNKSEEPQFLAPNRRAVQELRSRLIRTNIRHLIKEKNECKIALPKVTYRSNNKQSSESRHEMPQVYSKKADDNNLIFL